MLDNNTRQDTVTLSPKAIAALPGILFLGGFFGVWSGMFFGFIGMAVLSAIGLGSLAGVLPFAIGGAAFLGTLFLTYIRQKSITYTITPVGVEKEAGALSTSLTSVRFDDVTDVHYTQSLLDGVFDVGTVKLNTAGSNDKAIKIAHVEDARDWYNELDQRVSK